MASVKEILENGIQAIGQAAYQISDIMKYRFQNPATPLSTPENKLRDILTYIYNRPGSRNLDKVDDEVIAQMRNANLFPANMTIDTGSGTRFGTRNAYGKEGVRIFTDVTPPVNQKTISVGVTGICKGRQVRLSQKGENIGTHIEYAAVTPDGEVGTARWAPIPAFRRFINAEGHGMYTPVRVISNDYYFAVLYKSYDNELANYHIVLSPDLWDYSEPCFVCNENVDLDNDLSYRIYIDEFARIYVLNESFRNIAENSKCLFRVYDNVFTSNQPKLCGLSYTISGFNQITADHTDVEPRGFIEDVDTRKLWFFDWVNNIQYEVVHASDTEGSAFFEVPAIVSGSFPVTQAAMQITDLGFAPDKVYVSIRTNAGDPVWMTDICLTRDSPESDTILGRSYHGLTENTVAEPVKTISTDITTTKYGGYISKDGFVIHLGDEYSNMLCDFVAFGHASGNDPYLS